MDLEWFKNVYLSSGAQVNNIDGGNAGIATSQHYSKDGNTLSRKISNSSSASGFASITGGASAKEVSGYQTVEIAGATVNKLEGGQSSSAETSKFTNSEKLYQRNISLKENISATGSVDLKRGSVVGSLEVNGAIEDYKNVELLWATPGSGNSTYF